MKKETIKTIILSLLIINCIQLTAQIWFNEKLWPAGYNFFNYAMQNSLISDIVSIFNKNYSIEQISDSTTMPDKIVINGGGAKTVNYSGNSDFNDTIKLISPYIEKVFADSSVTSEIIDEQQWQTMLRSKSIFVEFGFDVDSKNISAIFNTNSSDTSKFGKVDRMTVYPETVLNSTAVCFKNTDNGNIIKFVVSGGADNLVSFIERETLGRKNEHAFAFEVRLDKNSSQSEVPKKVVLDSDVLLTMNSEEMSKIIVTNFCQDDEAVIRKADRILRAFGYNASQIRKTITQDGVVTYVENSATVKVYPDGLVEYNAVSTEKGIKISDGKTAPSKVINDVLNIAKSVITYAEINDTVVLRLRSPLDETPVYSYIAKFDRYYNGLPVISEQNSMYDGNTLYAEFENGYIKNFRILLQKLSLSENFSTPPTVLETIDKFCETLPPEKSALAIDNIYRCYYVDKEGEFSPKWCIKHNGVIDVP